MTRGEGDNDAADSILCLAVGLIARGDPLPEPIRDIIAETLFEHTQAFDRAKKPGPDAEDLVPRNVHIARAVYEIALEFRLPFTRNERLSAPPPRQLSGRR